MNYLIKVYILLTTFCTTSNYCAQPAKLPDSQEWIIVAKKNRKQIKAAPIKSNYRLRSKKKSAIAAPKKTTSQAVSAQSAFEKSLLQSNLEPCSLNLPAIQQYRLTPPPAPVATQPHSPMHDNIRGSEPKHGFDPTENI